MVTALLIGGTGPAGPDLAAERPDRDDEVTVLHHDMPEPA